MVNPRLNKKLIKMWLSKEEESALGNFLKFRNPDLIGILILKVNDRKDLT